MSVNDIIKSGNTPSQMWRKDTLGNITNLILSSVDKKTQSNEQEVQLCNYTDVYYNNFIRSSMDFMLATATEREISNCSLLIGDVVITKDSEKYNDIGVPAIIRDNIPNLVCGYHLAILRPLPHKVDGMFLFYALSILETQQQFWGRANGITRFGLRKNDIKNIEIMLPSISEQKSIANILTTLDDKIELNRRMNKTLEEMARALFKSWFVDFDPVRAKIEGRWQPGQSLPGLPAELYDLFPDRLVPSELGEIPDGWEVRPLRECYIITMGQSPPGHTYNEERNGLPFFQGRKDFGFRYPTNRIYCTAPNRIADPEDTLVSVRAPVGDLNMAWEQCCLGRGVAALRHKQGLSTFTYYTAWSLVDQLKQYEHTGTVFGAINKRQLESLKVLDIDAELLKAFEKLVKPFDEKIRSSIKESRILTSLRDALLPKLLSGAISINDLESNSLEEHGSQPDW